MAQIMPNGKQQFIDANGYPLAAGTVNFYIPGTTTLKDTWRDAAQTTLNTNPVSLDAGGYALIYGVGDYRQIVKDSLGNTIWDQIVSSPLGPLALSSGSTLVGFLQSGASAVARTMQDKSRETVSVLDFGAKGDGTTDDTAAFNAAIATGKRVFVPIPSVGYAVNGITVVNNMQIVGEKSGECLGPEFIVNANNGCVFLQPSSASIITHLHFENFTMRAGAGITGATGFYNTDKSKYTAYVTFRNIETHRTLAMGYNALFIYADWINCRDGYLPSAGGPFTHGFISSVAATYGQTNATNTNNLIRCKVFGTYNVNAAVQVGFGDDWTFSGCRWENMDTPVLYAQSVRSIKFLHNRAENIRSTQMLTLNQMGASGVGSSAVVRDSNFFIDATSFTFAVMDGPSRCGFSSCEWSILGAGAILASNGAALTENRNHKGISGTGAAGFMVGMYQDQQIPGKKLINGAADNGLTNMTLQNKGGVSADLGFAGAAPVTVGTSFVTIATSQTGYGALVRISGAVASGTYVGAQFSNLIDFQGTDIKQVYTARAIFGATPTFQVVGNDLQMKVDVATVTVLTTVFH